MKKFRIKNIIVGNRGLGHVLQTYRGWLGGWQDWENENEGEFKWMESDDKEYRQHAIELIKHLNGELIT